MRFVALLFLLLLPVSARADVRITRDFGGHVDQYKKRFAAIRDSGERVIIDGICNSACTLVLGIVPLNKICVTPRAALGFHQAYYDKRYTAGLYVTRVCRHRRTDVLLSAHAEGLDRASRAASPRQMKTIRNGVELWAIIDPCPDEF